MSNLSKGRKKRNGIRKGLPAIFMVVVVFCIIVGIRSYTLYQERNELAKKQEALENRIESEEERKKDLEELEKYMQTKKYMEEVAKTKLGLVYPDEILIEPENK